MASVPDVHFCTNPDNPLLCCRGHFPHKTSAGLCGRCNELQKVTTDQERARIMAMPSCDGCSLVSAYMRGKICVFCERLIDTAVTPATGDNHRAPLTNIANTRDLPDDSDTRALMLAHIQARAAKDLVKNPAVAVPGTRSIYVHAVTIVPSAEGAKQLGVAAQQFIETTLFSSVIEELADCWNVRWSRRCSERLTPEHFVLNFHKGIPVQRDSGLGTLGEFYDLAGLYLYLEALILIPEFEETTGCKVPDFILSTKDQKKRKKGLEYEEEATLRNVLEGLFKGQLYAFKRFKDVGLGKDIVSLDQNRTELILEVQRLVQLGWFYAEFERRANSGNVQIEALCVTEYLLAFELTPQKVDPSVASGYKDVDINIADVPMTWLMEPFRPGPSQNTVNAFAHFVYATSFGTIAVADIQTSRACIGNTAADVMFDLTTHTTEGNSGVGDHGTGGLTTFRQEHECISRCNKLNLGDLVDPDAEEPENDDL
ncbi:hypothetical protein B0H14DRAFT_3502355 [Mycena olivaceomarginata]|nr:hypothetical protein B0H14DRAFT_3502355 [Mycena olivaceomarginata]